MPGSLTKKMDKSGYFARGRIHLSQFALCRVSYGAGAGVACTHESGMGGFASSGTLNASWSGFTAAKMMMTTMATTTRNRKH